jgi:DNA-binding PadR family transcriptional regulator
MCAMTKGDFLSEFEMYVLLAVLRRGEEVPGAEVRQEIEAASGRSPSIGAVHTTLGRLEEKGLVNYRLSEPEPVRGGRARKQYRLTPAGQRALERSAAGLAQMLEGTGLRLRPGRAR